MTTTCWPYSYVWGFNGEEKKEKTKKFPAFMEHVNSSREIILNQINKLNKYNVK